MRIDAFPADFGWCLAIQRAVNTVLVVIGTEFRQLFLQVDGVPEEDVVEVFVGPEYSCSHRKVVMMESVDRWTLDHLARFG